MRVIPICTVERNRSGSCDSFKADNAALLPYFALFSNLTFRAETSAISDIESTPLHKIRSTIIIISM